MPPINVKHKLSYTQEAVNYDFFFLAPPNHYEGIELECGVEKLADDSPLADMPITKTGELTLSPVAVRKTLRVTASTGQNKYVDIVVSADRALDVQTTLVGQRYKDFGDITRVLDSRKRNDF